MITQIPRNVISRKWTSARADVFVRTADRLKSCFVPARHLGRGNDLPLLLPPGSFFLSLCLCQHMQRPSLLDAQDRYISFKRDTERKRGGDRLRCYTGPRIQTVFLDLSLLPRQDVRDVRTFLLRNSSGSTVTTACSGETVSLEMTRSRLMR